ncbi:MAG TPA: HD domain-containing phosphohydrolase [Solirubrobacteraceae bacterium]|jgi:putative two-component system response regulator
MVLPGELADSELFSHLPAAVLELLAAGARRRPFARGEVLFEEGEPGHELHVLRDGEVQVVRPGVGGVVLARCRRGDVFGELAVLTGEPRSATLVALSDGETLTVPAAALDAAFTRHPQTPRIVMAALARSLTLAKEELAGQNRVLEQRVRERTEEVRDAHHEVLRRLGEAVESRDDETGEHIFRMSRMAAGLARRAGLNAEESEMILRAAPLHDIGKIAVADAILRKPGPLSAEERLVMQTHTTVGARLLAGSRSPIVRLAELIARSHHERWDGTGYPDRLAADEIPLAARICAIADVYDALVSARHYKPPWTSQEALAEIRAGAGTQFDPALVAVFLRHADAIVAEAMAAPYTATIKAPPRVAAPAGAPARTV